MTIRIRPADDGDLGTLAALNAEVQRLHRTMSPGDFKDTAPEEFKAHFAEVLANPRCGLALAVEDGAPLGYVHYEVQERVESIFSYGLRRIYVHALSVAQTDRRRGIGGALMVHVEEEAARIGIDAIHLDTRATNEPAIRFFRSLGYEPVMIVSRKLIR